jgi:signal transduction histidine kinase
MRWFAIPKMALSMALAVLAVCVLVGINEAGYARSTASVNAIEEAQRTRAAVNRLLQHMLDAETGQRGYLLTGDPRYLEPYDLATADFGRNLDLLRGLYVSQPEDLAVFSQLSRHVSRKLAEMDLSVRLRKQGNEDAWKFVMLTDVGKEHMDAIRDHATRLIASSTRQMELAEAQIIRSLQLSRVGIAAVALAALVAFYLYLRQTNALNTAGLRQQEALERERDRLELEVRERTSSLAELATHLQQVREEERGHLARELHDELGALLTAAKLDVARLKSRLAGDPDSGTRLQHLNDKLNSGIALKRRIIEDLRPSALSNLGLVASLEILAREFGDRSGVAVDANVEPTELDETTQLTVYRLIQEALTNIGKYAGATEVEITLLNYASHVEVGVLDNGKGFDVKGIASTTHGLAGMRHRVQAIGGRLTVASGEGQGTRITAILPKSS